jgi:phosphatidylserine decarboxylase
MTIHKEGFKILGGTLLVSTMLTGGAFLVFDAALIWILTAIVCGIVFLLFLQFFRLPHRVNRASENELVAPCDGKVVVIEEVEEPEYFKGKRIQVSIFMSPLNVHANWTPCSGEVRYMKYHPGLFLVAWHPKSSTENERTTVVVEHAPGKEVLLRQVAGAVARRIVWYVNAGDKLNANDQFGFIKFGSRVDLYFPLGTEIVANIDDVTKGNETVIARWK